MSAVDVTERLDEVQRCIADWDFSGARDAVQGLLDEPDLSEDDRLTGRRLLAEALRELGDLDAAYDLADAVVAQATRRHGPSHPVTVHALAVLAAIRHDYDEWDEAERLYHRVLDSGADEDGDESIRRAIRLARVNFALLQRDRGDRPLALAMLNAAYAVHRREYGADDLDTIRIAAELAALQFADGNVAAARRLFTLAHAAARARLGSRHPFTRAVEWELAAVEPPMPSAPVSAMPVSPGPTNTAPAPVSPAGPVSPARPVSPAGPVSPAVPVSPVQPISPARPVVPHQRITPDRPVSPVRSMPPDRPASPDQPALSDESVGRAARVGVLARVGVPGRVVAILVGLALALAGLFVVRDRAASDPRAEPAPSPSVSNAVASEAAEGVQDLRLRDERTTLTVTWTALRVTVVVALARAGAAPVVLASVPAGTGEYVVRGVEPSVTYCVVVGPVDERAAITRAATVCTSRS